ncbi:MAG: hypothetical protein L6Q83_04775 [Gammaproteobacteria bacterium]|nr:hypothetical protein [Gammaproteobacteria bacterium]
MQPIRFPALVLAAAFALAGCGQSQPPSTPAAAPPPENTTAAATRDLSGLNMCDIVKPAEVAAVAGGTLATEPSWNGKACMYVIEMPNDTESYLLSVYEAALAEALLAYESAEEKGERIDGLWDEAWLGPRSAGNGFTLLVVRRGDIAFEASGDRRDVVLALGKLAVPRVQ